MTAVPITQINVGLNFGVSEIPVGRLAIRDRKIYFEYASSFLTLGLNVSPLSLPLQPGLHSFEKQLFEGLAGLFNDSLPDGWGRLLFDRTMRQQGILPAQFSPLDRLAYVGHAGMGALTYEPDYSNTEDISTPDLDWLAHQSLMVLEGEAEEVLDELLALNGSSAGARPKALVSFDPDTFRLVHGAVPASDNFEPWIVKFANAQDGPDSGAMEYVYAQMARDAGLEVMDTHLFSGKKNAGYFATKRFDRNNGKRLHMHTACGLLHSDFRAPSLDYEDLIELTALLTRDIRETTKMFRLAVFNVMAHNRDDHSKNVSFLMDESGAWRVSPAYDLTFSSGPGSEQSTMVMGEGRAPGSEHLRELGNVAGLKKNQVREILNQTRSALESWPQLAKVYGVKKTTIQLVEKRMQVG